ncbi:hypothetical protein DAEQUDRAFT_441589 [Daedalea quercina L-15889]|uniref:Uncharacterized protein n=1 Tax=Daedalea quercina L-15889 TaxID=1314783 RepID=A0A165N8V3_9APHY|nr:hypothetical protein DAEQUDRAFT_441589 [Daedalea quercina L-15889]
MSRLRRPACGRSRWIRPRRFVRASHRLAKAVHLPCSLSPADTGVYTQHEFSGGRDTGEARAVGGGGREHRPLRLCTHERLQYPIGEGGRRWSAPPHTPSGVETAVAGVQPSAFSPSLLCASQVAHAQPAVEMNGGGGGGGASLVCSGGSLERPPPIGPAPIAICGLITVAQTPVQTAGHCARLPNLLPAAAESNPARAAGPPSSASAPERPRASATRAGLAGGASPRKGRVAWRGDVIWRACAPISPSVWLIRAGEDPPRSHRRAARETRLPAASAVVPPCTSSRRILRFTSLRRASHLSGRPSLAATDAKACSVHARTGKEGRSSEPRYRFATRRRTVTARAQVAAWKPCPVSAARAAEARAMNAQALSASRRTVESAVLTASAALRSATGRRCQQRVVGPSRAVINHHTDAILRRASNKPILLGASAVSSPVASRKCVCRYRHRAPAFGPSFVPLSRSSGSRVPPGLGERTHVWRHACSPAVNGPPRRISRASTRALS